MEKKRFFVGNLPHEIDEDVIRSRFSKYGEVLSVELKFRYSGLYQNEIISAFAFVNLQGSQQSLLACLKKLPRKKWHGKEITVEFAKESILSRLENERRAIKDNVSGKTNHDASKTPESSCKSNNEDLFKNNEDSIKEDIRTSTLSKINFNSNENNSNILTKLENFSNVWKDCDEFSGRKITKFDDSSDFSAVINERHEDVVPKKSIGSKEKFNFVDSNKFSDIDQKNNGSKNKFSRNFINADEKRLKSIKEMKKAIDQRKQTIKKALSSVDSGNFNKKIVFNDDDDDDDIDYSKGVDNLHKTQKVNHYDKKSKLFNDESCDENEELQSFSVKQQFEGDKGKKLFELQSRFGNDSRFYMNEKFYESDEEKNDNEKQDIERLEEFDEKEETINDEVKKQLEILQSIVGTEVSSQQKKQKLKHVTSAAGVRFDPSVPEHEKFIVKPSSNDENEEGEKQKKSKKSKKKQKEEVKEQECVNKPSVSNETFYEVANELKETFKSTEKTTFSFTELFQTSKEQTLEKKEEKDTFKNADVNSKKKNAPYNNFIDDRFGGGDFTAEQDMPKLDEYKKVTKTGSLWHENFFYEISDPRFKEAHQFFSREEFEVDTGNFEGKRKMLKKIIKKKVMNKIRKDRPFKKKIGGMPKHRKNFKRRKLQ